MRLRFVQKPDKDSAPLRERRVDLETGVVGKATGPELRAQALFRDRFIGVVQVGHPLSIGEIRPERYAGGTLKFDRSTLSGSYFAFFSFTRSSRFTPSHMASAAATNTEE